jgi:hypothetical protein
MGTPASSPPWQPITFGGVASFARASIGRLLIVQFMVALLVGGSVSCFLAVAWFPVVEKAIAGLPEKGTIRRGQLEWTGPTPCLLAEATFLSIAVDLENSQPTGQSADVQVVLHRDGVRLRSLFGSLPIPYPRDWTIALNRVEVEPRWGAWQPFLLVGIGAGVLIGVILIWLVLATIYSLPLRLLTFYSDRDVSWLGCWRLAGAAQLPGALLMSGGILIYGFNRLNFIGLLFAWLLHVVIGWIYIWIAPARLSRLPGSVRRRVNPFGGAQKGRKRFGE